MSEQQTAFEGWAILELMGHRRLAGYVRDVEVFGGRMCRIDIPGDGPGTEATQFYGVQSIYCLTPTDEATARQAAWLSVVAPVTRWELPPAKIGTNCDPNDEKRRPLLSPQR